jgi:hypothetical protein
MVVTSKRELCLLTVPIGGERDISLRFDCSEPLGKGVRDGIVRGVIGYRGRAAV